MAHHPPNGATSGDLAVIEEAYRHVAAAHYRLATADGVDPDLAARCLEDLDAAMEKLDGMLPPVSSRPSTLTSAV
jgi:hypothetical protein